MKVVGLIALCFALAVGVGLGAATGAADDLPVPTDPTVTLPTLPTVTDPPPTVPPPTVPEPTPPPTVPEITWGAADDAAKYADDGGGWFYGELKGANLTQNRWTVGFDQSDPMAIKELPFLERAAPIRSEERRVGKECRSRWSPYH